MCFLPTREWVIAFDKPSRDLEGLGGALTSLLKTEKEIGEFSKDLTRASIAESLNSVHHAPR